MSVLPTVRRQLLDAVAAQAEPGVVLRPRPSRRLAGYLIALAAIAVPSFIAAGALVLVHAHRPSTTSSSPTAGATGVKTERQELIENFGVFRRRQTPADRDGRLLIFPLVLESGGGGPAFGGLRRRWGHPALDESLRRVVAIPVLNAKVGLEPVSWRPSRSSPRRAEGLEVVMRTGTASTIPPASEIDSGLSPTGIATVLAHGVALSDGPPALSDGSRGDTVGAVLVVPDGVASVTIRLIRVGRAPVAVNLSEYETTSATVHDNVAAFQLRVPTVVRRNAVAGILATDGVAQTTWFDARGRLIRRTTTSIDVFIKVVRRS